MNESLSTWRKLIEVSEKLWANPRHRLTLTHVEWEEKHVREKQGNLNSAKSQTAEGKFVDVALWKDFGYLLGRSSNHVDCLMHINYHKKSLKNLLRRETAPLTQP